MRIEMRQIGVRDEAKMICGIGSCGRELCCTKFMNRFELVSVKMAKEQNLALNPTKISGICGRLMCCLSYEFPVYMDLKKDLPKVGKHIVTPAGKGKIIRQNVLSQTVTVELEEGGEITIHASEI
jgi:cell fate regulator YaaT (PSP1 superfamily)